MTSNARVTLALLVAALLVAVPAGAQTVGGTLHGRVTDSSGAIVPGADIHVTHEDTGTLVSIQSDDRGWFLMTSVRPGNYRVEVARPGFRRHVQPVTVQVNQEFRIDIELRPGQMTETVTVEAPMPLDRRSPSLTTRIGPELVSNLPLDGRNFLDLTLLSAGAVPAAQGSAGSVRGEFAFNVNGAREDANTFLLDGAYNFDPELNAVGVRPPVEAVREFEVITSLPDASFGRATGALVNVVTRSGTNRFSGTVYDFHRSSAFDARNAFAPADDPAPEFRRQQFGGAVGGPLAASDWFFFADYEGTRLTEGITRATTVPTLAERAGDFSNSFLAAPINPFTFQPFAGAQIPSFFQDPIGVAIANLYPEPNRSGAANFVSSPELDDAVDQFDVRVDRAGRSLFTARYSFSDRRLFEPFAGPSFANVPGYGTDVPRRAQNFVASLSTPVTASLFNEVRSAWTRVSGGAFQENQDASLNQLVGLPDLSTDPRDFGLSFITVSGFSPLGDEFNNPQHSTTNMLQVSDTLSWSAGRHLVKAGGEFRLLRQDAFRDVQARGFIQFTDFAFTGNGLADLLLGLPTLTGGAVVDNHQDLRTHSYAFFVQDTLQLTSDLTLSAGLRYEFAAPPVDAADRVSLYDVDTGTIVPVGQNGVPRSGVEADRNNLAPRLGAAWSLSETTVIRGGYGISYDQASLAPNEFLYFNAPYFDLNLYFTQSNFLVTLADPFPADFPVALPDSATTVQRDLRTAYLHQFNVSLQQQVGRSRTVEIAFVGSRGRNLLAARDINQPAASPLPFNFRPNGVFEDILAMESRASSEYNALQVQFIQRLERGVSVTANYTLGKSMDDASGVFSSAGDANFPQNSNDPDAEWSRSNFDVRHRFTMSGLWQLPIGPGRRWLRDGVVATVLGNWDVYGVVFLQSGRPFTVAILPDINNSNTGRANLGFGFNDRPDLIGDASLSKPSADRWFDAGAFAFPPFGSFGNVGRNTLEGPGFTNVNLAFVRPIDFGTSALQLRVEVFNAFNSVNLAQPDNFLGSPTFGQILSAGAPRRIQIGARWSR